MKNEEWYNSNKIIKIAIIDKRISDRFEYKKERKILFIKIQEYIETWSGYKIKIKEWLNDYGFEYSIIDDEIYQKARLIISFVDDYKMIWFFDDEEYDQILSIKNELISMDSTCFNMFTDDNGVLKIKYPYNI